jgi:hypothetical protein
VCPLELRAGIIEGAWTPLAAKQATWVVAHLTPKEGEELFDLLGNMTPSKSTLDRLPKALSGPWETQRPHFEATLRRQEAVPNEAVTVVFQKWRWPCLHRPSKAIAVHKQTKDDVMHLDRFRKTDSPAHQALDARP